MTAANIRIGNLSGDREGYWGNVTGFDFCERNYDTTFYVGELWCVITNFIALPLFLGFVGFVWSKGGRITALTYFYLVVAALDEFCAGMSHLTLKMPWSQAQERCLGCTYIGFFVIFLLRYHRNNVCKAVILVLTGWFIFGGIVEALEDSFVSEWKGQAGSLPTLLGSMAPYINGVGLVVLLALGAYFQDFACTVMGADLLVLAVAYTIFGATDVYHGNCLKLPIWLHELGHLLGTLSDYLSTVVIIALDPEVEKVITTGRKLFVLPSLVSKSARDISPDDAMVQSLQPC